MNSKTFCAAPWVHLDITPVGNLQPCCIWKSGTKDKPHHFTEFDKWVNSDYLKTVRKNLHNGVTIPECHNCHVLEQANSSSLRLRYNEQFAEYKDYSTLDTDTWMTNPKDIVTLDLKLGNLCDLKCVMCNAENSSQIMTEYKLHKEKFDQLVSYYAPDTASDFSWPLSKEFKQFINRFKNNLKFVKFTGGEPTVVPYVIDFLESIQLPDEVTVALVTNANSSNQRFFDALTKFKLVNIAISLEGIESANEMLRYNSNWASIVENIKRYQAMPNTTVVINHVLQAFSTKTLVPLIRWCEDQNLQLAITVLDGPWHLRLNSAPPAAIDQFVLDLNTIKSTVLLNQGIVDNVLDIVKNYKYDPISEQRRKEYTILLDDLRNTKLSSII